MKFVSIVGARPQFIKTALISSFLQRKHQEILIHTGQHYDYSMSSIFFGELGIREPDYNLGIGSGPHGWQTGNMVIHLEEVLMKENPDWVIVYGDTNSTIAGALTASKLHIPIAHIEAGLRSFNRRMPEEINRVLTDHISDLLFCPTKTSIKNLADEGVLSGVHLTGDVMYDTLQHFLPLAETNSRIMDTLQLTPDSYYLATIHRAENTDDIKRLISVISCLEIIESPVIFPVHPRTMQAIIDHKLILPKNIRAIEPIGYLDMLILQKNASTVLTDSGGMQKESFLLGVPCITLRNETEWIETVESGWNVLVDVDPESVKMEIKKKRKPSDHPLSIFGNGKASERIVDILESVNLS